MKIGIAMNEYQGIAVARAAYPGEGSLLGLIYLTGKLSGEAGEFSEHLFKALRDDDVIGGPFELRHAGPPKPPNLMNILDPAPKVLSSERQEKLKKEAGDVLWYIAAIAKELGLELNEVAMSNIAKITGREASGTLNGDGDDR